MLNLVIWFIQVPFIKRKILWHCPSAYILLTMFLKWYPFQVLKNVSIYLLVKERWINEESIDGWRSSWNNDSILFRFLIMIFLATKISISDCFTSDSMETTDDKEKNVSVKKNRFGNSLPEIDTYVHLLTLIYMIDTKCYDKVWKFIGPPKLTATFILRQNSTKYY